MRIKKLISALLLSFVIAAGAAIQPPPTESQGLPCGDDCPPPSCNNISCSGVLNCLYHVNYNCSINAAGTECRNTFC